MSTVNVNSRNMKVYFAGFDNGNLFAADGDQNVASLIAERFEQLPINAVDDVLNGWNYHLLLLDKKLFVASMVIGGGSTRGERLLPLELPDKNANILDIAAGKDTFTVLTNAREIWQYKIYDNVWRKVTQFCGNNDDDEDQKGEREYPVKIYQNSSVIALTNFGRVYNIPVLVDMPKRVKFIDVARGFDHTIMLAENGDVYAMGLGTRGQLGNGDLEDCDNPKLIEALAGLKIVRISAGGWHSAAITEQGDLYTWGWNTNGELGIPDDDSKIIATPRLVDFSSEDLETAEVGVKDVRCGNVFTICMLDNNSMWGCGSNKYGQLGLSTISCQNSPKFIKLNTGIDENSIERFKCNEWSTVIFAR